MRLAENEYNVIARSKHRCCPPVLVGIRACAGGPSQSRSHFERLCPLFSSGRRVFSLQTCLLSPQVFDCWYLMLLELPERAEASALEHIWSFAIQPSRTTACALKRTIAEMWEKEWLETPWFAKTNEQKSRRHWFANTFTQNWNGLDSPNCMCFPRGVKRPISVVDLALHHGSGFHTP